MVYFVYTIVSLLSIYRLILLARVICSWIPYSHGSVIDRFSFSMTEPLLRPIRDFLLRFEAFRTFPFDLSTVILFVLITVVSRLSYLLL